MNDKAELESIAELVAGQLGYRTPKFCGKGSFEETYRAEDASGRIVALKLVDRKKLVLNARIVKLKL